MRMLTEADAAMRYHLFDTRLGTCGVAWSEQGLTRLQLPESTRAATERRLRAGRAASDRLPASIERAIGEVKRYMAGEKTEFDKIVLDLAGVGEFHRQLYEALRRVGWGKVTTYGELARQVDAPGAARAVGQAMGRNPIPIIIPCHRVLASGGKVGGFSAFGGGATKQRLLALEGVQLGEPSLRLPGL